MDLAKLGGLRTSCRPKSSYSTPVSSPGFRPSLEAQRCPARLPASPSVADRDHCRDLCAMEVLSRTGLVRKNPPALLPSALRNTLATRGRPLQRRERSRKRLSSPGDRALLIAFRAQPVAPFGLPGSAISSPSIANFARPHKPLLFFAFSNPEIRTFGRCSSWWSRRPFCQERQLRASLHHFIAIMSKDDRGGNR